MVVVGSAHGAVSRMRFKVPLAPGSALAEIQASLSLCLTSLSACLSLSAQSHIQCACLQMVDMESDTHEGCLTVWQHCHSDDVAAVDINTDKQQVSCAWTCVCLIYNCTPFPSEYSIHSPNLWVLLAPAILAVQAHSGTL